MSESLGTVVTKHGQTVEVVIDRKAWAPDIVWASVLDGQVIAGGVSSNESWALADAISRTPYAPAPPPPAEPADNPWAEM